MQFNENTWVSSNPQTSTNNVQNTFGASQNVWELGNWNEKQREFIKQVDIQITDDVKNSLSHYQMYGEADVDREISQKIEKTFRNYNQYFLGKYLGLSQSDIVFIQTMISNHLKTEWQNNKQQFSRKKQLQEQEGTIPVSFPAQQTIFTAPTNKYVVQTPQNLPPLSAYVPATSQSIHQSQSSSQQKPIQFGGYDQQEQQAVQPLNTPPLATGYDQIQNGYPANYHYDASQINSGYRTSLQYTNRKPAPLPDSNAFINTEIDYQRSNAQYPTGNHFSPTLKQVIEEQRGEAALENNTPAAVFPDNQKQENNQQISGDALQTDLPRVSLEKSTGPWFGLSNQGQVITASQTRQDAKDYADELIEQLRQKQTQPQAQVVEQSVEPSEDPINEDPTINSVPVQHPPYSPPASYSSQRNDAIGRLNYAHQQVEQNNFETTGNIANVERGKANEVIQSGSSVPINGNSGVKGYRKYPIPVQHTPSYGPHSVPNIYSSTPQTENSINIIEETTPSTLNEENLPWWKRFGNKVKQGAVSLKETFSG